MASIRCDSNIKVIETSILDKDFFEHHTKKQVSTPNTQNQNWAWNPKCFALPPLSYWNIQSFVQILIGEHIQHVTAYWCFVHRRPPAKTCNWISPIDFNVILCSNLCKSMYCFQREPVIFRGVDIGVCSKRWTSDYLAEALGDTEVKIHVCSEDKLDFVNKNFVYRYGHWH